MPLAVSIGQIHTTKGMCIVHIMDFNFLKREFRKTTVVRRSFQAQWFVKWPWLHYDSVRDLAFCHTCKFLSATLAAEKQSNCVLSQLLNLFDFLHDKHLHYMEMMNMMAASCNFFASDQILGVMGTTVLKEIASAIQHAHYFTIMAVTDSSSKRTSCHLFQKCG